MKTIRIISLFALALLLGVIACDRTEQQLTEPKLTSKNTTDYGRPYKIHIYPVPVPDTDTWVTFGLIADTHIDASNAAISKYRDTDNVKRNRKVINDINIDAVSAGCLGIVHLGDMTDAGDVQNLVAFRQLYEDDYPGKDGGAISGKKDTDYDAYSCGYRIHKPVFPTLGNHGPYHKWASYIADRVVDAPGLVASYGSATYIWRWGQYYFINLGMWAGSYEYENRDAIDYDKLNWLKNWLANNVGNSGLGVLIFQHYGWDGFSTNGQWWSPFMRNLELDVLMRRNLDGDRDEEPGNPYNIIGIFTGHNHDQEFTKIYAGLDAQGNSVYFDNLVFRDSGFEGGHYGFSIVTLDGAKLKIHTKNIGGNNEWYWWEKPIHLGP